jgi:uncharacterized membrane protein YhaH (DUF805 family)
MIKVIERYLSFQGRLARLPYFARGFGLGIGAAVIFMLSIPLFSSGSVLGYGAGIAVVIAALALLFMGSISLTVRRLHDFGLSGYHAVWVFAAQLGGAVLSHVSTTAAVFSLPLAAVCLWLLFWPGSAAANRFGEASA